MNKQNISYKPTGGVCSKNMYIETEGNRITKVEVTGGCPGNSRGIISLLEGMEIEHVIKRLEGVTCKGKNTSCPDQLAQALKQLKATPTLPFK